jgi:UDP-glucose 4-epimerase
VGLKFRRACVTGGAGFIGSHLVRRLLALDMEVVALDNLSVGVRSNVPAGARLVECDILDINQTESAIRGCDIVFHLAARVAIRSSFEFVVEDTMTNVSGTASVLRAAQRSGSVRKVICTSSMAVYADSPTPDPVSEEHLARPISPYGISKLAAESLTHNMCAAAGIDSVVVRLFNTYGPGQKLSPYVGVVTIFVNKLARSEQPVIFGDGLQARDFVHVEDIVSGFICAMDGDVSGETFNIGTGQATTVNEVYRLVAGHMRAPGEPNHVPAAPGELRFSVADISKARKILGYSPRRGFAASVGAVADEILTGSTSPLAVLL